MILVTTVAECREDILACLHDAGLNTADREDAFDCLADCLIEGMIRLSEDVPAQDAENHSQDEGISWLFDHDGVQLAAGSGRPVLLKGRPIRLHDMAYFALSFALGLESGNIGEAIASCGLDAASVTQVAATLAVTVLNIAYAFSFVDGLEEDELMLLDEICWQKGRDRFSKQEAFEWFTPVAGKSSAPARPLLRRVYGKKTSRSLGQEDFGKALRTLRERNVLEEEEGGYRISKHLLMVPAPKLGRNDAANE